MIRVLAQIVVRQVYAPKEEIPDEPDPPPALRAPHTASRAPMAEPGMEASDASRWLEPADHALVVLFTQLAQRHVQAARARGADP